AAVESASGRKLEVREMPRRPGDLAAVVADPSRLKARLGWRPTYDRLDHIVSHALAWEAAQTANPHPVTSFDEVATAAFSKQVHGLGIYGWRAAASGRISNS